jgi:hypothetical protein
MKIYAALLALLLSGCLQNPQTQPEKTTNASANLIGLSLSAGSLVPGFDSSTLEYSVSAGSGITSTTVTPTAAAASDQSVFVNGAAVLSGTASAPVTLVEGTNSISIVVTASGGSKKTYHVTVTRAKTVSVELARLDLSWKGKNLFDSHFVTPAFNPADTVYTLGGASNIDTLRITAVAEDSASATLAINGVAIASGAARDVALAEGANTIKIAVSQKGFRKTYTVLATRNSKSTPLPSEITLAMGAQGSPTLGSVLELDAGKTLLSSEANANQEKIDLVFLFYQGAFHLDNARAAKDAGILNNINQTDNYDGTRIKDIQVVKVSSKPKDQETAKLDLLAGTETRSNKVTGGEMFVIRTTEGKTAVVTMGPITGTDNKASASVKVSVFP